MKTNLYATSFLAVIFTAFSFTASAQKQKYVKQLPATPVVYMTEVNQKGYILIEDDWVHTDNGYQYNGCRWVKMRKGYTWKPGYWKQHNRHGVKWVSGRWL
ncbi:MAG: hypothetical protein V4556_12630 [Bacteroidota bacterium]